MSNKVGAGEPQKQKPLRSRRTPERHDTIKPAVTDTAGGAARREASPGRGDFRMISARAIARMGDYQSATKLYMEILSDRPKDKPALAALARIGIAHKNIGILSTVAKQAGLLDQATLASVVGLLLRFDAVFVLRDMIQREGALAADFVAPTVRRCHSMLRKTAGGNEENRAQRALLCRCILDIAPDDASARSGLARLFEKDLVAVRKLSGSELRKAAAKILDQDPRNTEALRQHAAACLDMGDLASAYASLARLPDADLTQPRISAQFVVASSASRSLEEHAGDLRRLNASKTDRNSVLVHRASRMGLKAASTARNHVAVIAFADLVLAQKEGDSTADKLRCVAVTQLNRILQKAMRAGAVSQVESLWESIAHVADVDVSSAVMRFFLRTKDYGRAESIAERLLLKEPENSMANQVKAKLHHERGEYGQALHRAMTVLKDNPQDLAMMRILKYAGARLTPAQRPASMSANNVRNV
ncbi:hypothetical protein [Mesorhizobium sp. M2A.F.Ca.ET.039.01.1.1]|uniref:tetratricopeptide repeat protein n=1 Tax=Mesorhizobium sp. M2A.F.Ca.ET.039.01.1.1 TaxID=2496746 RepID=UPI000FCB70F9|nr:hypothetical protein [Mesorhizobium sp. M2A.F.Ca.ET.039.01.1.1]RWX62869.1 hypothetical protein EOA24_26770 [Mesorhizobium sp. M2A.F.Ca.ET.039.01.1.1]